MTNELKKKVVEDYWRKRLEGECPGLELPIFGTGDGSAGSLEKELSVKESERLLKISRGNDMALFVLVLGVYNVMVSRYSGEEDVWVGSVTPRKDGKEPQAVILRNWVLNGLTLKELMGNIKKDVSEDFKFLSDYSFNRLYEWWRREKTHDLFHMGFIYEGFQARCGDLEKFPFLLVLKRDPERFVLGAEYDAGKYERFVAERFLNSIAGVLARFGELLDTPVEQLDILSAEEKKEILERFNDTTADYPVDRTLDGLFREQADRVPDRVGVCGNVSLTYRELNRLAEEWAGVLREKGAGNGMIVALKSERSVEMIIAILAILKAGAAYMPIAPDVPQERLDYILRDSAASVLVTISDRTDVSGTCSPKNDFGLDITELDSVDGAARKHRLQIGAHKTGGAAYVIYTSGTTGKPKGVLVNHRNAVNLVYTLQDRYPLNEDDVYLLKTPYVFDVSVTELFGFYINGGQLAILEPGGEKEPVKIIDAIRRYRVTHINFVPSLFYAFIDYLYLYKDKSVSLGGLRYIFLAGEALLPELVERFNRLGLNSRLRLENLYGPTEAAVYGSGFSLRDLREGGPVPIGRPLANMGLYILSPGGQVQPIGVPGELHIAGSGLARGYLNRPELTADRFVFPGKSSEKMKEPIFPPSLRLYKTGDLTRWAFTGDVEYLGRLDHQIKIRGFRVELGEIENRLAAHDGISAVIVTARKVGGGDLAICSYIVPSAGGVLSGLDMSELGETLSGFLSRWLPEYMIPGYWVVLDRLPLNKSGKVDRRALPEPGTDGGVEYVAPADDLELELAGIWSDILDTGDCEIGRNHHFFRLGGHSLKATMLTSRLHRQFDVRLRLVDVFKVPVLKDMADFIRGAGRERFLVMERAPEQEFYALSAAQKRLYILHGVTLNSTLYNMPQGYVVEDKGNYSGNTGSAVNVRLEHAFLKLIERHESLRTSFHMNGDEPVQRIHPAGELDFKIEEYRENTRETVDTFIRPFDLARAPLLRAGLIYPAKSGDKPVLLVDSHHIISDGISQDIFRRELTSLYYGEELPEPAYRYRDFSHWQQQPGWREAVERQEQFWLEQFSDDVPVLDLPADAARPAKRDTAGGGFAHILDEPESTGLRALATDTGTTFFMVFLGIVDVLLAKLSGVEDVTVGTPVAGRRGSHLEEVVGVFINTLALRHYPRSDKPFNAFLNEIRENTLAAFENQEYPFEELVEQLNLVRDPGRNPLFDIMFFTETAGETEDTALLTPYEFDWNVTKFDLTLAAVDRGDTIEVFWKYTAALFNPDTIRRFSIYLKTVINRVIANPEIEIGQISLLSDEERWEILYRFNDTDTEYPADFTLHRLFEEQAARTPDRVAVSGNEALTYGQLNRDAREWAEILREKGAGRGTIVALQIGRSARMIIAMLAVLKAGAAYLPIAPDIPEERLNYIMGDSSATLLIAASHRTDRSETSPPANSRVFDLSRLKTPVIDTRENTSQAGYPCGARCAAYVIYTSGTTGKPKGVVVEHGNAANTVSWFSREYLQVREKPAHVLMMSDYTFDPSVNQVFGTLMSGGTVHMISKEELFHLDRLRTLIDRWQIEVLNFVPTLLHDLVSGREKLKSVRCILSGAERLDEKTKNAILASGYDLYNQYGPTETAIDALVGKCSDAPVTLGRPIANVKCYILDADLNPVPVGVPGELYISGPGVARGYLNRPELTAERFYRQHTDTNGGSLRRGTMFRALTADSHQTDKRVQGQKDTHAGTTFRAPAGNEPQPLSFFKTGDKVRWLPSGEVEFFGRLDHQVKVRGYRVELGEIENRLAMHEGIKETVVTAILRDGGDTALCAYVVPVPGGLLDEPETTGLSDVLGGFLSQWLPEYMVPVYWVSLEKLPLNKSGKVNRAALPEPTDMETDGFVQPVDQIETQLAQLWGGVLGIDGQTVGRNHHFFRSGGHSLKATILAARIHKAFDVRLSLGDIFSAPVLKDMAAMLRRAESERFASLERVPEKEFYAMSPAQKRLFILQAMELDSTNYNIPQALEVREQNGGVIDRQKLTEILLTIIRRHDSLRTSFHMNNEAPVQRIHPMEELAFGIREYTADESGGFEAAAKDFFSPFDLADAPLLRVGIVTRRNRDEILLVDTHHIITDGLSQVIFRKELAALYGGEELEPPLLRYIDYSEWMQGSAGREAIGKQGRYWLERFGDGVPVLELPLDYPRPAVQDYQGRGLSIILDEKETAGLKAMAKDTGTTLFMVMLGVFGVLLAKLAGTEDITVGTPVAGRRHSDLEPIIGVFINTLALRLFPRWEQSFHAFLNETGKDTLAAFENQEYPFEDLVENLDLVRDAARNPLFDIMFSVETIREKNEIRNPKLILTPVELDWNQTKFDISVFAEDRGDTIEVLWQYAAKLFKSETIRRFARYYKIVIARVTGNPGLEIGNISLLPDDEKEEILFRFNDTDTQYPADQTLHRLFEEQADRTPHRVAVSGHEMLTYGQLNRDARQWAEILREKGAGQGTIIALKAERSVQMIIAMLAILKTGAAYLPIAPDLPQERIDYMLTDSAASILAVPTGRDCLHIDVLKPVRNRLPAKDERCAAYVIYTSGTTGKPKGVVVEHRNAVNTISWFSREYLSGWEKSSHVLLMSDYTFDPSVNQVFGTLMSGGAVHIISKDELFDMHKLRSLIDRWQIQLLNFVPTLLCDLLSGKEKLKSIRSVLSGAERLDEKTKDAILLVGYDLYNHYGPTETAIDALVGKCSEAPVTLGRPIANVKCFILDANLIPVPVGVPGELYISGPGVARGYLNRPELTAERFYRRYIIANGYSPRRSMKHSTPTGNEPLPSSFFKTGDKVRWLPSGEVEFFGRLDHQVKIRGYRVELGEIESRLAMHDNVKETVVTAVQRDSGDTALCAYVVSREDGGNGNEFSRFLSQWLPDYMVPVYWVMLDSLPLNKSGKVDRSRLPQPELTGGSEYAAPRDELETRLASIWARVLGIEENIIGIDSNFFALGGHSLKATVLISNIHKTFNVHIPLGQMFRAPDIRRLADYIRAAKPSAYIAMKAVEKKEYYDLSYAQRRLWLLCQLEETSAAYNIPFGFAMNGDFEPGTFERAVQATAQRHESLRTVFITVNGEPRQKIIDDFRFTLEQTDLRNMEENGREDRCAGMYRQTAGHVFDLENGPLFLFRAARLEDRKWLIMYNFHHIVDDGWSHGIILNEIFFLYNAFRNRTDSELPPPGIQYKDYSAWHNRLVNGEAFKKTGRMLLKKFKDKPNGMELPLDFNRPPVQTFNGSRVSLQLGNEISDRLNRLCAQQDVTLFMTSLALCSIFLSRYCGETAIVIGSPSAGRNRVELEKMVGFLVNTLVYRVEVQPGTTFSRLLQQVKKETLDVFEHQDYPFDLLVDRMDLQRDMSRSPIFNVLLALDNTGTFDENLSVSGIELEDYAGIEETGISKFDLTFLISGGGGGLNVTVEYNTDLFHRDSIERMAQNFRHLTGECVTGIQTPAAELEIMTPAEKQDILYRFNETATAFPSGQTIPQLFRYHVEHHPDRAAVISGDTTLSYRELNERAERLARILVEKGVKADIIIALMAERTPAMICGIMGILQSGGAYLPLDKNFPVDRVRFMLEDTCAPVLVTSSGLLADSEATRDWDGEILDLEPILDDLSGRNEDRRPVDHNSDSLAYVIYTSGTTGRPKANLTSHTNAVRVVKETNYIELEPHDRILQLSNYAFDGSVFDIYGALLNGAALVLMPPGEAGSVDILADTLKRHSVNVFFLTTAMFNALVDLDIESLRHVRRILFGGERVSVDHTARAMEFMGPNRVLHVYGPTETTVYASYYPVESIDRRTGNVPIGKPLANTTAFILDTRMQPVPLGVAGELYIGGPGVARGYLNHPELTAQRFIEYSLPSEPGHNKSGEPVRLYKTGDRVRWLPGGHIEFLDRIDHQVKLRGYRIELGEIQHHLREHPGIKEVFPCIYTDRAGDKHLCAYLVMEPETRQEQITEATDSRFPELVDRINRRLSQFLPPYMIPSYYVPMENLPLNNSGKVDRRALPEPAMSSSRGKTPPETETEDRLADIWADVLGVEKDTLGMEDNFFHRGGHSLKGSRMIAAVQQILQVKVPLAQLFKTPDIRSLARFIDNASRSAYAAITAAEPREYYPLSFNQKRLWFLHLRQPDTPAFNLTGQCLFEEAVDPAVMQRAVDKIVSRHDSFRTYFIIHDDHPVQKIVDHVQVPVEIRDIAPDVNEKPGQLDRLEEKLFEEMSNRLFHLDHAPLLRIMLVKAGPRHCRVIYSMHHIVGDGWSLEILKKELAHYYHRFKENRNGDLKPLAVQYRDFAVWHNDQIGDQNGDQIGEHIGNESGNKYRNHPSYTFWREKLKFGVPILQLPRSAAAHKEDIAGAGYRYYLENRVKEKLLEFAALNRTSLFTVMFAFYLLVLRRYTNQREIVSSIINAGRTREEISPVIGFFVNSLVFTVQIDDHEPLDAFVRRIHTDVMDVFHHQDFPLEPVFRDLGVPYPEIPVSFNMANVMEGTSLSEIDAPVPHHIPEGHDAKFDLEPYITEYKNIMEIRWAYKKNFFNPAMIEHLANDYVKLLEFFIQDPTVSYSSYKQVKTEKTKKRVIKRKKKV